MAKKRSPSVPVGPGEKCPSCGDTMQRFEHPKGWRPRPGQPFHFKFWDRCGCGHLKHYEQAKVHAEWALRRPQKELTPDQLRASRALRARLPDSTSKRRRQWLAEQMAIEERFAIISEFDAVECETVVQICEAKNSRSPA